MARSSFGRSNARGEHISRIFRRTGLDGQSVDAGVYKNIPALPNGTAPYDRLHESSHS